MYVIEEGEKPEQGHIDVQTESVVVAESGSSAAFGPRKPDRTWMDGGEGRPLMQGEEGAIAACAPDETRAYNDEGIGSRAGSLQSLDTEASEKDWKETLQVRTRLIIIY